jgi:aldehyde:ferredoxin oxidoreductase
VWLEITEDEVFFHPADDLWGMDTYETEDRVREWIRRNRPGNPKSEVVVMGPAGEDPVSVAVIENNYWRSAGRTVTGAVMG